MPGAGASFINNDPQVPLDIEVSNPPSSDFPLTPYDAIPLADRVVTHNRAKKLELDMFLYGFRTVTWQALPRHLILTDPIESFLQCAPENLMELNKFKDIPNLDKELATICAFKTLKECDAYLNLPHNAKLKSHFVESLHYGNGRYTDLSWAGWGVRSELGGALSKDTTGKHRLAEHQQIIRAAVLNLGVELKEDKSNPNPKPNERVFNGTLDGSPPIVLFTLNIDSIGGITLMKGKLGTNIPPEHKDKAIIAYIAQQASFQQCAGSNSLPLNSEAGKAVDPLMLLRMKEIAVCKHYMHVDDRAVHQAVIDAFNASDHPNKEALIARWERLSAISATFDLDPNRQKTRKERTADSKMAKKLIQSGELEDMLKANIYSRAPTTDPIPPLSRRSLSL